MMLRLQHAIVICLGLSAHAMWAQSSWPSYPNNTSISVTSAGNVGIGTASPATNLQVNGGIGINGGSISSRGLSISNSSYTGIALQTTATGQIWYIDNRGNVDSPANRLDISTGGLDLMTILSNGNVGIGAYNPLHRLHVAGTIGAEEIIVSSTGADYVFDPGYRLTPLSEVDRYVKENGHLPDIPSAADLQKKGASVGEMQAKLLAKVEELTLHMIQQQKENQDLRERIARLESAAGEAVPTVGK